MMTPTEFARPVFRDNQPHMRLSGLRRLESQRLMTRLANQMEASTFGEAMITLDRLLRLWPEDEDLLETKVFLELQIAAGPPGELRCLGRHTADIRSVDFTPDGLLALSASGGKLENGVYVEGVGNAVCVWEVATGKRVLQFRGHESQIAGAVFAPDGSLIGSRRGNLALWDAQTGRCRCRMEHKARTVSGLAISPTGSHVVAGSDDSLLRLWDAQNGCQTGRLTGHAAGVTGVTFSRDGAWILSGSYDRTARLWDARTGKEVLCLAGHSLSVLSVAFSPLGCLAATAGTDKSIRLWNLPGGEEVHCMKGHANQVNSIVFTPDGRRLLSGSSDNTIRVWDVALGQELYRLEGHTDNVMSVAISASGKLILSGSRDATVRLWHLPT
jgi:WD40 repeat protein